MTALAHQLTIKNDHPHEAIIYQISTLDQSVISEPITIEPGQQSSNKSKDTDNKTLLVTIHIASKEAEILHPDLVIDVKDEELCLIRFTQDEAIEASHCRRGNEDTAE
jgi:hypothetical protein